MLSFFKDQKEQDANLDIFAGLNPQEIEEQLLHQLQIFLSAPQVMDTLVGATKQNEAEIISNLQKFASDSSLWKRNERELKKLTDEYQYFLSLLDEEQAAKAHGENNPKEVKKNQLAVRMLATNHPDAIDLLRIARSIAQNVKDGRLQRDVLHHVVNLERLPSMLREKRLLTDKKNDLLTNILTEANKIYTTAPTKPYGMLTVHEIQSLKRRNAVEKFIDDCAKFLYTFFRKFIYIISLGFFSPGKVIDINTAFVRNFHDASISNDNQQPTQSPDQIHSDSNNKHSKTKLLIDEKRNTLQHYIKGDAPESFVLAGPKYKKRSGELKSILKKSGPRASEANNNQTQIKL